MANFARVQRAIIDTQPPAVPKKRRRRACQAPATPPQYLLTSEVCDITRRSRETILLWEKKGLLHCVRPGGGKRGPKLFCRRAVLRLLGED